jgi:hypothetical protein
MPLNSYDVGALISRAPGAIVTPFALGDGGQFTVNGERPNANAFRVDGISANTGVGSLALPGSFPGSTLPGMSAIGSLQNLANEDEIQQVDLRAPSFSPESGERPGEQVEIATRSGGDAFHGGVFGYSRPEALSGYDWFAQSCEATLPRASSFSEGATLGGPLARDRTFFFASFQQSFVSDSAMELTAVPPLTAVSNAPGGLRPLLAAFPSPTGCHLDTSNSIAATGFRSHASVSSYGLRLDQAVGASRRVFLRVSNAPSRSSGSGLDIRNDVLGWQTATAGLTTAHAEWTQEARVNISRASSRSDMEGASQQSAVFGSLGRLLPLNGALGSLINGFAISGIGEIEAGAGGAADQNQWEASYSLSRNFGSHELRAGGDYIRLSPRRDRPVQTVSLVAPGIENLVSGGPLGVTVSSMWPEIANIQIGSLFLQDNVRITQKLSLLYGFRWEWTPPVAAQQISFPYIGVWNGPGTLPIQLGSVSNVDAARWPSSKWQIAPRLALAYAPFKSGLVLRLAGGTFYDTSLGSALDPVNGAPFQAWQYSPSGGLPAPAASTMITRLPPPNLHLPQVLEWRASIEQSLGRSLLSLSYIGSAGKDLLHQQAYLTPETQILQNLNLTSNGKSSYDALQIRLTGNVTTNLASISTYTWGHSIDNGSQSSAVYLALPSGIAPSDRGSSSFDIRHALRSSLSYRIPVPNVAPAWRRWIKNWNVGSTLEARTGFPIDVSTVDRALGLGFENEDRPYIIPGVPQWIANPWAPGGKQINPAAFTMIPSPGLGALALGRNGLTGNPLFQVDTNLRRKLSFGHVSMTITLTAFNLLNHPSFANPVALLQNPFFGQSASMANLMLGSGTPNTGLTPIFQSGGPRMFEIGCHLSF